MNFKLIINWRFPQEGLLTTEKNNTVALRERNNSMF